MALSRSARTALSLLLFCFLFADLLLPLTSAHGGGGGTDQHPHGTSSSSLRYQPLILTKLYCLIIVFLATFLPGITPCVFKWNESFLLLGTEFAGGIFLATALLHFLSDANSTFESLLPDKDYPFAFLLACAGYLLAMLSDCIVHSMFAVEGQLQVSCAMSTTDMESGGAAASTEAIGQQCMCGDGAAYGIMQANYGGGAAQHPEKTKNSNSMATVQQVASTTSSIDAILLMLALCFHSVFEGIAIGVAGNIHDAWTALWTISIHKVFAAIAMGIALLRMMPSRPRLQCALYSFAFGISSPIGVAIGIIVDSTTQGHVADWIYGVAMGVASGIFVYVAINHLLVKGYVPQRKIRVDTPFYKLLATTLGVAVMAIVMTWDQ